MKVQQTLQKGEVPMRRTLERRHFPVSGVTRGEVVIATTFTHPTRGTVRCPAAPVAHAAMLAAGLPVSNAPIPAGAGDAVLHAVSYVDPSGAVVGLGIAAHRADERAVRLARDTVTAWAAVMRTRRVLLETTGPTCAGLRREAAMIAKVTGPVAVLASVADRGDVADRWPWRDVRLVERLADVPAGGTVVLPAHGVDADTAARARATEGLRVVDATCPLVARAHATARRFVREKAKVVVLGGDGHAAVPPLAAQAPESVVVTSADDIDAMADPAELVAFVVSPGLAAEDAGALAARLRSRFAGTIGQHPDEYCYAASDRRAAVRAVASCSELTLVLGDPESTDTRMLTATAIAVGGRVELLGDPGLLAPEWLATATSVGILVGASARPDLAGEVIEALSGLGPVSVARRQVTTDVEHTKPVLARVRRAS